jgi:hypothetical protein
VHCVVVMLRRDGCLRSHLEKENRVGEGMHDSRPRTHVQESQAGRRMYAWPMQIGQPPVSKLKRLFTALSQERREAGARLLQEVSRSNAQLIERKKALAAAERDEELRIAAYIAQKDAREAQVAEEQERVRKDRERETARLRGMQVNCAIPVVDGH